MLFSSGDLPSDPGLTAAHGGEPGVVVIVHAAKVQAAVDDVGEQFVGQGKGFEMALGGGDLGADDEFAVLEGDDIGRGGVLQELFMQTSALPGIDENDLNAGKACGPEGGEPLRNALSLLLQSAQGDPQPFLAVVNPYPWLVLFLCGIFGSQRAHGACF